MGLKKMCPGVRICINKALKKNARLSNFEFVIAFSKWVIFNGAYRRDVLRTFVVINGCRVKINNTIFVVDFSLKFGPICFIMW
jgi:hypothetical protein